MMRPEVDVVPTAYRFESFASPERFAEGHVDQFCVAGVIR